MLDRYLVWFKAHERLIVIVLVLGAGSFGYSKWIESSAMDAHAKAAVAEQIAASQKAQADKLAAQLEQQTALFQQSEIQREKEMATLALAIASRDAASSTKIAQVTAPKTPPQAVNDLNAAYPKLPVPLVPTDAGANVPTVDLQQFTVAKIEGDTAKADLVDTRNALTHSQDSLSQAVALMKGKDDLLTAKDTEITNNIKACDAEKKDLKAQARKSKWKIFWYGVAAGFIGRQAIKSYTGM